MFFGVQRDEINKRVLMTDHGKCQKFKILGRCGKLDMFREQNAEQDNWSIQRYEIITVDERKAGSITCLMDDQKQDFDVDLSRRYDGVLG